MDEKSKKIVSTLGIIFLIILFIGSICEFVSIPEANQSIKLYNVKGFQLVFIATLFYIYSIFTNKKTIFYISFIVAIIGYIITFSAVSDLSNAIIASSGEKVNTIMSYHIGFYLYISSLIMLIINSIIYLILGLNTKEKSNNISNTIQNKIIEHNNIEEQYIISNYICGLNGYDNLLNKLVIIVSKEKSKKIELLISGEKEINIIIDYDNLQKISIKKSIVMNNTGKVIQNDENANKILATMLLGSFGPVIGGSKLVDTISNLNNYNKVGFKDFFEIKIEYTLNGKPCLIMVKTNNNPKDFFEKFNDKLIVN